jgi:acetyl esterase/lipase
MSTPASLDPGLVAPESIDAETAEFNRELEAAIAAARERTLPVPARELRVRVLVPERVRGACLHRHGGGWTLGAAQQSDVRNWAPARRARARIEAFLRSGDADCAT